jgi:hypothetical protein
MSTSRRFELHRDVDVSGISGTGVVADGVRFPDGSVAIRWRGERPSSVFWSDMEHVVAIHGHSGSTRVVWRDPSEDVPTADWSMSWAELTGYVAQALDDGTQIDPAQLLQYLSELKRKALAPVRDWMDSVKDGGRDH